MENYLRSDITIHYTYHHLHHVVVASVKEHWRQGLYQNEKFTKKKDSFELGDT